MVSSSRVMAGPRFAPRVAPVTFWYVAVAGTLALLDILTFPIAPLLERLECVPSLLASRPWTLLTHPFAVHAQSPFGLLLAGYVIWWTGSELEQWWGSRIQAGFLLTIAAATGLALWAGWALLGVDARVFGLGTVLCAGLTVWCLRRPTATIILLIVPVPAWVLLALEVVTLFATFARPYGALIGLLALAGCPGLAAAYFFWGQHLHRALKRLSGLGDARRAAREKAKRDERVREIFERSGLRLVDDDKSGKK